jgi:hypothetical protein
MTDAGDITIEEFNSECESLTKQIEEVLLGWDPATCGAVLHSVLMIRVLSAGMTIEEFLEMSRKAYQAALSTTKETT